MPVVVEAVPQGPARGRGIAMTEMNAGDTGLARPWRAFGIDAPLALLWIDAPLALLWIDAPSARCGNGKTKWKRKC